MNRRHQAVNDAEIVVDDLSQRRQAVGGAACIGHDVHISGVLVLIDAHDEHRRIGGRSGDNDLLGAGLEMGGSLLGRGENAGGLDDIFLSLIHI